MQQRRAKAHFPLFQVKSLSMDQGAAARFVLTSALTAMDRSKDNTGSYRISLALVDSRSGIVVAQGSARATAEAVDMTPTKYYRDSPSTTKNQTARCGPACRVVWQGRLLLQGAPYAVPTWRYWQ